MTLARLGATSVMMIVMLAAAGCGGDEDADSPDGALRALAKAVNDVDTAAVDRLLCDAVRGESTSIADFLEQAAKADPKLKDLRYRAEAGPVSNRTDASATGVLRVTVSGVPADLSPDGQQFLDLSQGPRPVNLVGENEQVRLIVENGTWVACEA